MYIVYYSQWGWDAESTDYSKLIMMKFETADAVRNYINDVHIPEIREEECLNGNPEITDDGNCIEYYFEENSFHCSFEIINIDDLKTFGA